MTIRCPDCGGESSVVDSRVIGTTQRRRRKCLDKGCSSRWSTYEVGREQMVVFRELLLLEEKMQSLREGLAGMSVVAQAIVEDMDLNAEERLPARLRLGGR